MGEKTGIEWAHHTFNPVIGCTKVSDGCRNCYAEQSIAAKMRKGGPVEWGPRGLRQRTSKGYWRQPARWDAQAARDGVRRRVFCASLSDVFEGPETMSAESRPVVRQARLDLLYEVFSTPNLDWLLLTKRPENVMCQLEEALLDTPDEFLARWICGWLDGEAPKNVWVGTSVENQQAADERIPHLLKIPAVVRFLSMEPLLGPVELACTGTGDALFGDGNFVDWVIVGGESGPNARPMHPDWVRALLHQCHSLHHPISFFFKQWGAWLPCDQADHIPSDDPYWSGDALAIFEDGHVQDAKAPSQFGVYGDSVDTAKVGKKVAGRLLDGVLWGEVPTPAT